MQADLRLQIDDLRRQLKDALKLVCGKGCEAEKSELRRQKVRQGWDVCERA